MNKLQISKLHKLSVEEKIKVVQDLWDDIAKEQSIDIIPEKHKKILNERLQMIKEGHVPLKSWAEIQKKYNNL